VSGPGDEKRRWDDSGQPAMTVREMVLSHEASIEVLKKQAQAVEIYLRQLRWILAAVLGGVFGAIGLGVLNLATGSGT